MKMNRNAVFVIIILMVSYMSYGIVGCDSGNSGSSNRTIINGVLQEVILAEGPSIKFDKKNKNMLSRYLDIISPAVPAHAQVPDIKVRVIENGRTLDMDRTNQLGEFKLRFRSRTGLVTLEFDVQGISLSRIIPVTEKSDVALDVIIDTTPPQIIFDRWVVSQKKFSVNSTNEFIFDELEAEFRLDGNGSRCIQAVNESRVEIRVKSIILTDCSEAVRAENFATIMLDADNDINIIANRDAVRARDNSSIRIGMTALPINNNIFITSNRENGIRTSEAAEVIIDPQNSCTITGAKDAIRSTGTSTINPNGCTLVDG